MAPSCHQPQTRTHTRSSNLGKGHQVIKFPKPTKDEYTTARSNFHALSTEIGWIVSFSMKHKIFNREKIDQFFLFRFDGTIEALPGSISSVNKRKNKMPFSVIQSVVTGIKNQYLSPSGWVPTAEHALEYKPSMVRDYVLIKKNLCPSPQEKIICRALNIADQAIVLFDEEKTLAINPTEEIITECHVEKKTILVLTRDNVFIIDNPMA